MNPRADSTPTFAPGERVLVRDEEWIVRGTNRTLTDAVALKVTGLSELVRGKDAIFLSDIDDIEPLRPEDTKLVEDESPQFARSRLYLESLLRKTPPTDSRIHIGHRGAADDAPYQLVPAHRALSRVRPRLLIADGVGLGKTIEVGILLSELIRRGRGRRILVVALKSILEQFQQELWARYAIPLVRLDSDGIQRVRTQIPSNMNPFHHFDRVIVSIDTLKRDEKYAAFLEQARWDAVVIDECQNVALRGSTASKRRRLAERLAHTADALILTSATPHDGTPRSLASILKLLEPTAVPNEDRFDPDQIRELFVRRFKRDVAAESGGAFYERKTSLERIEASDAEEAALVALSKATFKAIHRGGGGVLFRTTLLKAFLSSPEACIETIGERKKRMDKAAEKLDPADVAHDHEVLDELAALAAAVPPETNSKLAHLVQRLDELGVERPDGERVVVFSERIRTLRLLQEVLRARYGLSEEAVPVFHGGLSDKDQQKLVKSFGTAKAPVRIFLGSDAASEGINLHFFCHRMFHFDVPWSLITLEQRNGRIDRFGQENEPDIRYLVLTPKDEDVSGDLRVIDRLIEKEAEAHKNLGDAALLMKAYDAEKEEARVASAIEGRIAPEEAIPEVDAAYDENDPLLAALLGGAAPATHAKPETANAVSLYPDDLEYAKAAFAELRREDAAVKVEIYKDPAGFLLTAPDDLRVRFEHLPPELRPARDQQLQLTVDRDRVMQSLVEAREEQDRFPDWSLFWPLHPVAEWLDDRLLAHFGRHEAPVIDVAQLPDQAEVALLFQGVISNKRSQPVSVEWFAVGYAGGARTGVAPLEELIPVAALDGALANRSQTHDLDAYAALVPGAVEAAREHLDARRKQRGEELLGPLKKELKRLRKWFDGVKPKQNPQLGFQDDSFGSDKAIDEAKLAPEEARQLEQAKKAYEAYDTYVREVLATVSRASLRLAAVLSADRG
ncbi:MAG: helicase-related protein [Deltaproteobacteria bacterium]